MAVTSEKLIRVFCKLTGYAPEDVWGYNVKTLGVSTSNGGKYVVSPNGKQVRKLSGPDYPNLTKTVKTEEAEAE